MPSKVTNPNTWTVTFRPRRGGDADVPKRIQRLVQTGSQYLGLRCVHIVGPDGETVTKEATVEGRTRLQE